MIYKKNFMEIFQYFVTLFFYKSINKIFIINKIKMIYPKVKKIIFIKKPDPPTYFGCLLKRAARFIKFKR